MASKTIQIADKPTLDRIAHAVGVAENKIYGLKINKKGSNPATRCEYLMDAVGMTPAKMNFTTGEFEYGDWADVWFVKDNFPCMMLANGTIDYKLDPNDYSKKEDGTTDSDIANTSYAGNAMSAMPLVWIKQYETGNYKYIYLANYKVDEGYHAFAHTDANGDVKNYMFMSIFKGAQVGSTTTLRSLSGLQPMYSKTAENEITYAVANGSGWFTKTWAQRNLMQCLCRMIFCNDNSQSVLGNGNLNYNSSASPTYGVLKTGTLNDKGQFWGANDNTHQVKAFHQEAVWGDQWDRIAGLVNGNGVIRAKMTFPYPTSALTTKATFEHYDVVGYTPQGTSGGYINDTQMSEYGDIPYKASGSSSTYECDGLWFNNGQLNYALVGGGCFDGSPCGLFCLLLDNTASVTYWSLGASLSYT